jgi:hypothetical protein
MTRRQLLAHVAQAWSQSEAEGAWINRLGPPEQTAQWICQDPWLRLGRPLFKHLPEQLSGDAQHGTAQHVEHRTAGQPCIPSSVHEEVRARGLRSL